MRREVSLDSLRGLAAIVVLVAHTTIAGLYNVEPIWSHIKWTPLRIFWAGHQAVILFFVLSGFSLTCMLFDKKNSYRQYLIARFFRLYPTYIISIIIAIIIYFFLEYIGLKWEKNWLNVVKPILNIGNLIQHVFMIGYFDTNTINPPIWSIIYEMRISIIFPFIYILVKKHDKTPVIVMILISIAIAVLWKKYPFLTNGISIDIMKTFHYMTFFFIGSWVAFHKQQLKSLINVLSKKNKIIVLSFGLIFFSYPFDNPWDQTERALGDIVISFGAVILMILIMCSSILEHGFFRWLGKISYSMYLNHCVILNMSLILFYNKWGSLSVWLSTIIFTLIFASLMHKLVEQPSINLSRRFFKNR